MNRRIKTISAITLVSIILTGCGGGGESTDNSIESYPFDAPAISETDKNAYLTAVNNARATGRSCGALGWFDSVASVTWNDGLYKSAYEHSQDMSAKGVFSHSGSGTDTDWTSQVLNLGRASNVEDRISNNTGEKPNGYIFKENVTKGTTSLNAVMNSLLSSDSHCSAIMDKELKEFGMANVGIYWTQDYRGKL